MKSSTNIPTLEIRQPKPLALTPNPILFPGPARSVAGLERELARLPHLTADHRHVSRNARHDARDARQAKSAAEAIVALPGPAEVLHLAIGGRFALFDFIPAVLSMTGRKIDELRICTLGFSRRNIDALCSLIDSGQIRGVKVLASHYFAGTSGGLFEHAQAELGKRLDATFGSARNHAKLLLLKLDDARTFAVESSANLRSCKNIETITIIGDPGVYTFHRQWIDELFMEGAQ